MMKNTLWMFSLVGLLVGCAGPTRHIDLSQVEPVVPVVQVVQAVQAVQAVQVAAAPSPTRRTLGCGASSRPT